MVVGPGLGDRSAITIFGDRTVVWVRVVDDRVGAVGFQFVEAPLDPLELLALVPVRGDDQVREDPEHQ